MSQTAGTAVVMDERRRSLLGEALTQLFDFVAGTGQSARIGVFGDSANKLKWIGLSQSDGGEFSGITNDWFDGECPSDPTFYCKDRDPGVVFDAALTFLCNEFAGDANFRLQLHLGTNDPVLHANTADENPRLAPAPDFPGL